MKISHSILTAALMGAALAAGAQDAPSWLRYPSISPDGKTIAFSYKGDIYTVPAAGGTATRLTSNTAYESAPIWSPDGKNIAFSSDRYGSADIFVMPAVGGVPRRLTTLSVSAIPQAWLDSETILYRSNLMPDAKDSQFPSGQFPQVYKVKIDGSRPQMFSSLAMDAVNVDPEGQRLLYQDMKGYEDPWRKHHTSSITRDIWLVDNIEGDRSFRKITSFKGEDRNPVWTPDRKGFYYLSEQNGSFNLYRSDLEGKSKQLTQFETHPVRFLSSSKDGKLVFTYDGEIYTMREGDAKPQKVAISIVNDIEEPAVLMRTYGSGATDLAVSPSGKEVAFILHGDVFVTSVEYGTTKRITDTPYQERDIEFSPDGRTLVYSSERDNGTWGIYTTEIVRDDDKYFTYAKELKETPIVVSDKTSFQPRFSPDGKEIAYLENREEIKAINLKTKQIRTILDGKYNYSYSDGDQYFEWSPDSKWILAQFFEDGGWNHVDVALVKADGSGEFTNLTQSAYTDESPKFVLDGKAMIWESDRAGYRSHGSWGAESDIYIMFFDAEAYDNFLRTKEELALIDEMKEDAEKDDADSKDGKKDKKKDGKKDSKKDGKKDDKKDGKKSGKKGAKDDDEDAVEPLKFDVVNHKDRVVRLTNISSNLADAVLSKKGDKLYYLMPNPNDEYDLWEIDLKKRSSKILADDISGGMLIPDKEMENLFILSSSGISKIKMEDGSAKKVSYSAEFNYRPAEERQYIFNHVWRQVQDKFYDPTIRNMDWEGMAKHYQKYLPHINNGYDFQEMLSELLGELNGSHTGARFYGDYASAREPQVAVLGAFYDPTYDGDGLKVQEVIARGPLTLGGTKIKAGTIITAIDDKPIKAGEDYYPLFRGKVGKKMKVKYRNPDGTTGEDEIKGIGVGEQSDLLYRRWVEAKRKLVDSLSGGRIAYVHVRGMDSPSFRNTYSELLGRNRNKEAVIVDTRHNGGGWLHDDLISLLTGTKYANYSPRGKYISDAPHDRWTKPSCMLVCEDNYSDAHATPWAYKTLGVGKLIGAPVPGTMTAVWWERQLDPNYVFGIPQTGVLDMNGNYLENQLLMPDIEVYNTPESQLRGEDTQLEVAVKEMLKEADAAKAKAKK